MPPSSPPEPPRHRHLFRTPTALPELGAITELILVSALSDRPADVCVRPGAPPAIGIGLWALDKAVLKVRGEG